MGESFSVKINGDEFDSYMYKSAAASSYGPLSGLIIINENKVLNGVMLLPWQKFTFEAMLDT